MMKPLTYLKAFAGAAVLFVLIALYVREFSFFNLTFNLPRLIGGALLTGLVLGCWLGYRWQKKGADPVEKVQLVLMAIVLTLFVMPLLAGMTNRLFSFRPVMQVPVQWVEESPYFSDRYGIIKGEKVRPSGYHHFFYKNNKLVRISSDRPLFPGSQRGDTVLLPVRKGFWGAEYLER